MSRQNGVGTITPSWWWLTSFLTPKPSPRTHLRLLHPPSSRCPDPNPDAYKRTCPDEQWLKQTLLITLRGYPAGTIGLPKKKKKTVSFSFILFLYIQDRWHNAAIHTRHSCTVRQLLLAHVLLAHCVGLIASEVNKIGDKNQLKKRPGTQEAAVRWSGSWSTMT